MKITLSLIVLGTIFTSSHGFLGGLLGGWEKGKGCKVDLKAAKICDSFPRFNKTDETIKNTLSYTSESVQQDFETIKNGSRKLDFAIIDIQNATKKKCGSHLRDHVIQHCQSVINATNQIKMSLDHIPSSEIVAISISIDSWSAKYNELTEQCKNSSVFSEETANNMKASYEELDSLLKISVTTFTNYHLENTLAGAAQDTVKTGSADTMTKVYNAFSLPLLQKCHLTFLEHVTKFKSYVSESQKEFKNITSNCNKLEEYINSSNKSEEFKTKVNSSLRQFCRVVEELKIQTIEERQRSAVACGEIASKSKDHINPIRKSVDPKIHLCVHNLMANNESIGCFQQVTSTLQNSLNQSLTELGDCSTRAMVCNTQLESDVKNTIDSFSSKVQESLDLADADEAQVNSNLIIFLCYYKLLLLITNHFNLLHYYLYLS